MCIACIYITYSQPVLTAEVQAGEVGLVPRAGRSTTGGQKIWPPPWGAGAHTGWMLALFFFFLFNYYYFAEEAQLQRVS